MTAILLGADQGRRCSGSCGDAELKPQYAASISPNESVQRDRVLRRIRGNDGLHAVLYRSVDLHGNQETAKVRMVGIDTLGPVGAARNATVKKG